MDFCNGVALGPRVTRWTWGEGRYKLAREWGVEGRDKNGGRWRKRGGSMWGGQGEWEEDWQIHEGGCGSRGEEVEYLGGQELGLGVFRQRA